MMTEVAQEGSGELAGPTNTIRNISKNQELSGNIMSYQEILGEVGNQESGNFGGFQELLGYVMNYLEISGEFRK